MGMTQSDEFCEIYNRFMEEYDKGEEICEIKKAILSEYLEQFDEKDGVLHDVYFAIAKAEWMCGALSEEMLARVKEIVEKGENLVFYKELGASDKDLKLRQKKLEEFLLSLQKPREKARSRRAPSKEKDFPPFLVGDCLAYRHEEGYRVAILLDRYKKEGWKEQIFCALLYRTFTEEELKTIRFQDEEIGYMNGYVAGEFPGKSNFKKVGALQVPAGIKEQVTASLLYGWKSDFKAPFKNATGMTVGKLLSVCRSESASSVLPKFKAGDVVSMPYSGGFGYRVAVIMERFDLGDGERMLLCILKNTYLAFDKEWLDEDIGRLGSYRAFELPDTSAWQKVGRAPMPSRICERFFGIGKYPFGNKMDFVTEYSSAPSMCLRKLFEARGMTVR
jgi:hypothetical protein